MYSWLDASRKEIRLLHVHPGAWNDDIECHLQTVSLNDNPKFYAISYVWGDPTITLPITIDGEPLEITQNLRNGLQRLRRTNEALVIYADAACINQSDLNERSEQVQLMGEIYSSAEEVFIWLGYGNDKQAPTEVPNTIDWTGDERDDEIVDAYFKRSKYQEAGREHKNKAEDVLGLFVYLRIRAMDKHLADTPFFTVDNDRLCPQEGWQAVIRAMNTFSANPCGAATLQDSKQRGEKLSLRQVMRRVNLLEATDVRDKVFGVLGLVTDWQGLHPIIPDYSLPPEEVFAQAIVRDIQGTHALEPAQTISEVGPRLYEADSKPQDIVDAIATCYRMIEAAKERGREVPTTQASDEALWRTLTGDSWRTLQLNEADSSRHTPEISKRQKFGNTNVARLGRNLQNWYQTRATGHVAEETYHSASERFQVRLEVTICSLEIRMCMG
ncbi:uncharacterized protein J4E88_003871 [Alternaria novae-zelandiae]|uniref:uncharacterized protein n=1 Tax=Alternaria novae-zelandiae TaxID=430562 RepID=UPI0020C1E17C|nr:uncharacterized protein J4E88_003871 [Alternaria novae-zelandiae]KAI4686034.1 hypothetical protein J4E88_003871 [Alternaria novae-zelandiae]